jgi:hypothetical protein
MAADFILGLKKHRLYVEEKSKMPLRLILRTAPQKNSLLLFFETW